MEKKIELITTSSGQEVITAEGYKNANDAFEESSEYLASLNRGKSEKLIRIGVDYRGLHTIYLFTISLAVETGTKFPGISRDTQELIDRIKTLSNEKNELINELTRTAVDLRSANEALTEFSIPSVRQVSILILSRRQTSIEYLLEKHK